MEPQTQLVGFAGVGSLFEAMYRARRAWDEWDVAADPRQKTPLRRAPWKG